MGTYNIVITNAAESDLLEIGKYVSKVLLEPETAQEIISRIGDAISTLEYMPQRSVLVNDHRLAQMGIRSILVDNYIVFYIVTEEMKTVTIIRVLYNRRNWKYLL